MPVAYSYIRFSSPEQIKGDSLRRQMALSAKYAAEHNLALDTRLDLGNSAYKKEHLKKGALGVFLKEVEQGSVRPGSFLLVESLDRLSRAKVLDALQQFINLINAGITIVTLMDNQVYSTNALDDNWTRLIISIAIMARAYEESDSKSKRIAANWEERRLKAREGGLKLTRKCPRWLKLCDDRTAFIVIPEAAAVVERIFQLVLEGHGSHSIEYVFNQEKVPTFGRKDTWNRNSILKILNNRWVLGEYQPMRVKAGQRTPADEAIPDYYPRIISDATYYAVQQIMERKRHVAAGRKGRSVANILSGLCRCGYCGGSMIYVDKGGKSAPFLVCSNSKRGVGCRYVPWPYEEIEFRTLHFTKELRIEDFTDDLTKSAVSRLAAVRGKLSELRQGQANLIAALEQAPDITALVKRLSGLETELNEQLKLEKQLENIIEGSVSDERRIADLAQLRAKLEKSDGNDLYNLRLRLNSELRQMLEVVKFFPDGHDPNCLNDPHLLPEDQGKGMWQGREHRYVEFQFRNGNFRSFHG